MSDSVVDARFEQAKACFFEGLSCFQAARFDEAERHFLAALALVPGRASTRVNLAATRLRLARPAEALQDAEAVLAVEPGHRDACYQRACALAALGRLDEALAGFECVLAFDDSQAAVWLQHAQTLQAMDRRDEALSSYDRALAIEPALPEAWSRRGDVLREANRLDEAAHAFREALRYGADAELNAYYLAAVSREAAPANAPHAYVRALFDGYAEEFDRHLVEALGYQAHAVLTRGLAGLAQRAFDSALDLGCGTGLCGPLLRPMAKRLVGVDLSRAMLGKAEALGVYDLLVAADLLGFLGSDGERHDLVVAADVFIYVGELSAVFAAVHAASTPGAMFCFTVELPEHDALELQLLPSLRYAHSEGYVRRLAEQHGFAVAHLAKQPVRKDQRQPVDGLYVYLRRR